jgi:hypothetical protein
MIYFEVFADTVYDRTISSFTIHSTGESHQAIAGHTIAINSYTFNTTTKLTYKTFITESKDGPNETMSWAYSKSFDYYFQAAGDYPVEDDHFTQSSYEASWTIKNTSSSSWSSTRTVRGGNTINYRDGSTQMIASGGSGTGASGSGTIFTQAAILAALVTSAGFAEVLKTTTSVSWYIPQITSSSVTVGAGTDTSTVPTTTYTWTNSTTLGLVSPDPTVSTTQWVWTTTGSVSYPYYEGKVRFSTIYLAEPREGLLSVGASSGVQTAFSSAESFVKSPITETTSYSAITSTAVSGISSTAVSTAVTGGGYLSPIVVSVPVSYVKNLTVLPHETDSYEVYSVTGWSFVGDSMGINATPETKINLVSYSSNMSVGTTSVVLDGFYQSSSELAAITRKVVTTIAGVEKIWMTPLLVGESKTITGAGPITVVMNSDETHTSQIDYTSSTSATAGSSQTGFAKSAVASAYSNNEPTAAWMPAYPHFALPPGGSSGIALGGATATIQGLVSTWGTDGKRGVIELPFAIGSVLYKSSSVTIADNTSSTTGLLTTSLTVGSSFSYSPSSHVAPGATVGFNTGAWVIASPSGTTTSLIEAYVSSSWSHAVALWPSKGAFLTTFMADSPIVSARSQYVTPDYMNA